MVAVWPMVQLGDLLELTRTRVRVAAGTNYKRITVRLKGQGVVLRDIADGASIRTETQYEAHAGQFVFSRIDARNGAFGIVPGELDRSIVSGNFLTYAIAEDKVVPKYLEFFTRRAPFWEACAAISEGTTNRVPVRLDEFLRLEIPLPPLTEQRRIVSRIDELAAQIHEASTLRQKAAWEGEALARAVSRKMLSDTWPRIRLEELCPVITDGTHQTPQYAEEGAVFLSAQNVKPFRFMPENHRKVSLEDFRAYTARNKPQRGDVLLTRVGAGIGEAAVVDQEIQFAIYVSLALIRTDKERLLPEFLVHWLNSAAGREGSRRETLGRGHSQGNLNLKLLRDFLVPVPAVSEQRRIVAALDALRAKVDALRLLQTETVSELAMLLPAILDRAFHGEL